MSQPPHLTCDSVEHYTPPEVVEPARAVLGAVDLDPFSCAEANRTVRAAAFYSAPPPGTGQAEWATSPRNGWARRWYGRLLVNPPGGLVDDAGWPILPGCDVTGACGLPAGDGVPGEYCMDSAGAALRPRTAGGAPGAFGHRHRGRHSSQKRAWFKLAAEYLAGRVASATFVCFSVEILQSSQSDPPPALAGHLPLDFPICYPSRRVGYVRPGGEVGRQPPHASCVVYLPPRWRGRGPAPRDGSWMRRIPAAPPAVPAPAPMLEWDAVAVYRFVDAFAPLGRVVVPS